MNQLSLFATLRSPMIVRPVDPDGHVIQGAACRTFTLPHPRYAWDMSRIELHPARDGLWMWSVNFNTGYGASGYKVGEKWGQFALCPEDALHYAIEELRDRISRQQLYDKSAGKIVTKILEWADSIAIEASS